MADRLLDVSKLPFERVYTCADGSEINLREHLEAHADAVEALAARSLVRDNETGSFGFAMAAPGTRWKHILVNWDQPEKFVWFAGGWGPQRDYYVANAVRKMRALLRIASRLQACEDEDFSTLRVRLMNPGAFENVVEGKNPDGTFPWGDFPWGGAVLQHMGSLKLMGGTSSLSQFEDDFMTKLVLGGVGQKIILGDKLLPAA